MTIGVDYTGRLGNQLFIYSYVRSLMERLPQCDYQVVANFRRSYGGSSEDGFTDSLKYFHVQPYRIEDVNLEWQYGSFKQRMVYLAYELLQRIPLTREWDSLQRLLRHVLEHFNFYFSDGDDAARPIGHLHKDSIFVRGFFQDRRNFDAIRSILLEELSPVFPPLECNKELYDVAAQPNSVCVTVRRGDYLSTQNKKNFYVCTPEYFEKAIALLCQHVEAPTFIFFSDDKEWVREHMSVPDRPCYYENVDTPVWESLRLMYSCHHFIISNSTFSWWAQYLGRRADKLVICPSRWYANEWRTNLIDDSFMLVDV